MNRSSARAAIALVLGWSTPAGADPLALKTADGKAIAAERLGSGARGVVLVHDAERSAADWEGFSARLAGNGFAVVAVNLRGHGGSKAAADPLTEADWPRMTAEVDAAVAWLGSHGSTEIAVLGAAVGANLALAAAAANPEIDDVVLLSPALSGRGVTLTEPLAAWKGPLLVVADAKNPADARTATLLGAQAAGAVRVELVQAGATGHRMLHTVATLESLLVGWLSGARDGAEGVLQDRKPGVPGTTAIQTTGKGFGEDP